MGYNEGIARMPKDFITFALASQSDKVPTMRYDLGVIAVIQKEEGFNRTGILKEKRRLHLMGFRLAKSRDSIEKRRCHQESNSRSSLRGKCLGIIFHQRTS